MKITIVGAGNLGSHLLSGFLSAGAQVVQMFSRSISKAISATENTAVEAIDNLADLSWDTDLVVIAVHDDAIASVGVEVRRHLKTPLIAHTAGSVTSLVLHNEGKYGVFYPLQTFSSGRPVDWTAIPILITAQHASSLEALEQAARMLSGNVYAISDQERLALHLAATMANNFSNHMFALARQIATDHAFDFELLKPLILETAKKVMTMSPIDAQTGPAMRGDDDTMSKHRQLLIDKPEIMQLYNAISTSIISLNGQ